MEFNAQEKITSDGRKHAEPHKDCERNFALFQRYAKNFSHKIQDSKTENVYNPQTEQWERVERIVEPKCAMIRFSRGFHPLSFHQRHDEFIKELNGLLEMVGVPKMASSGSYLAQDRRSGFDPDVDGFKETLQF